MGDSKDVWESPWRRDWSPGTPRVDRNERILLVMSFGEEKKVSELNEGSAFFVRCIFGSTHNLLLNHLHLQI